MSEADKLGFLICIHTGYPHPRYLDQLLTQRDYEHWASFLEWYYRKPTDGR